VFGPGVISWPSWWRVKGGAPWVASWIRLRIASRATKLSDRVTSPISRARSSPSNWNWNPRLRRCKPRTGQTTYQPDLARKYLHIPEQVQPEGVNLCETG
jgi:hypothetical protein